jgi:hypothetical protein
MSVPSALTGPHAGSAGCCICDEEIRQLFRF